MFDTNNETKIYITIMCSNNTELISYLKSRSVDNTKRKNKINGVSEK